MTRAAPEVAMEFEKTIGYTFQNKEYLSIALTHSSYANETKEPVQNNERLEFLGDAVLSIVVSDYLFKRFHMAEGDLTKLRAAIVCEKGLFTMAQKIDLGSQLRLGRGEELMGGRERPSVVSDAFEALIAAIYLDGGTDCAADFIMKFILDDIENKSMFHDSKTYLQEILQKDHKDPITYQLAQTRGPEHDRVFVMQVLLGDKVIGTGEGHSKQAAGQEAAYHAILGLNRQAK